MGFDWKDEEERPAPAAGSVVVSSFPSVGFAATVAAHYMVQTLKLPRTGRFDSDELPPIAVVQSGQVNPAIRVYGRPGLSLILSEFPPLPSTVTGLARAILDGAERRGARAVIGLEGVMPTGTVLEDDGTTASPGDDGTVWAVASRPASPVLEGLVKAGARPLEDGVLGGVSGALLVQGLARKIPVAVLLVRARSSEGMPDNRAGAVLIEVLDRFLPELSIDTRPLRTQAEVIERAIRAALKDREKAHHGPVPEGRDPSIYQ